MTYTINPVVTIGGVNYTQEVLNGVTCTLGRTNVDEQPRAGYCTISIVEFDVNTTPILIDDLIQIRIDNSVGTDITLWTGYVADLTKTVRNWGTAGYATETRITGIGSLAKVNKRQTGSGGYPKEFDGDRIKEILFEIAGITYANVDPTEQWQDINPLTPWQSYDIFIGTIDTPGTFELKAYSGGSTNGLALAQTMAQSGLGLIYENAEGKITYSDFSNRINKVSTNGFLELEADAILAPSLTSTSRLSDLVNDVTITYKNNQTTNDSDPNSIALYGTFEANVTTQLENLSDAEQRVDYFLSTRAFPRYSLTQINLLLSLDLLDNTFRDNIIAIEVNQPISVASLPPNIYDGTFSGFVEGYTWVINENELFLTLNVSDFALSQIEMNWLQVPPAEVWNTITPSLTWANARSVL